jgi:hypothetical protein
MPFDAPAIKPSNPRPKIVKEGPALDLSWDDFLQEMRYGFHGVWRDSQREPSKTRRGRAQS